MNSNSVKPLQMIIAASTIALLMLISLIDVKQVAGRSMEPHLQKNHTLIVYRGAYGFILPFINKYVVFWSSIQPGDVIVYKNPYNEQSVVKKCIAVGGDPFIVKNNTIKINTYELKVSALTVEKLTGLEALPANSVLAIGSNLPISIDSRHYGYITRERIYGRVVYPSLPELTNSHREARGK